MTRFYEVAEANDRLSELEPLLVTLAQQRVQLIRLRDRMLGAEAEARVVTERGGGSTPLAERTPSAADELQLTRLRMQGLIDQMQAAVARLDDLGIVLRDIETGLVDFPASVAGRQVWLCWRVGERGIGWWHELQDGVAGRQPIDDLG